MLQVTVRAQSCLYAYICSQKSHRVVEYLRLFGHHRSLPAQTPYTCIKHLKLPVENEPANVILTRAGPRCARDRDEPHCTPVDVLSFSLCSATVNACFVSGRCLSSQLLERIQPLLPPPGQGPWRDPLTGQLAFRKVFSLSG